MFADKTQKLIVVNSTIVISSNCFDINDEIAVKKRGQFHLYSVSQQKTKENKNPTQI